MTSQSERNGYIYWGWECSFKNEDVDLEESDEPFNPVLSEEAEDYLETIESMAEALREHHQPVTRSGPYLRSSGTITITRQDVDHWREDALDALGTIIINKKHPMDSHYPHQCQQCEKDLKWKELLQTNLKVDKEIIYTHYPHKYTTKIFNFNENFEIYKRLKCWWRSKHVEFLCCNCFRSEIVKKREIH